MFYWGFMLSHFFFVLLGKLFNEMARWVQEDNETGVYYETWTVKSDSGANATTWFDSYDCSQFVHRTYKKLMELGTQLSSQTPLKYTKIYLYSGEPLYLGDDSIFQQSSTKDLAADIRQFYYSFRSHQSTVEMIKSLLEALEKMVVEKTFYFYYNSQYWKLPMKYPYLKITYEEIPFPWPNTFRWYYISIRFLKEHSVKKSVN